MAELSSRSPITTTRRHAYLVEPEHDLEMTQRSLEERRIFAAYALGQLEPGLVELTSWWTAKGDHGRGLALFAKGGLGDALFCMGEAEAVDAILRLHQGPRVTYATFQPEHLAAMKRRFILVSETAMSRMAVTAATFRAVPQPEGVTMRRLIDRDTKVLNRLYATEGSPTYYSTAHVREGVYYGVFMGDRLIAAAGTHVVGPAQGIAVVGNVFTHPDHRGKGYAEAATSIVTQSLLQRCRDVVLTVDPSNGPAVRAYRKLGYEHWCYIMEGAAVRKDPIGVASWMRRRLAGWRGRRYGGELVYA